jgi:hypothetical protein
MVQHTYRAHDFISHPKFLEHLGERENVSAEDARYAQTHTADLVLSHENNGQGYETVVQQPAQFDRNYNYDFEMTKKDVADIKAGRWSEPLIQKLRNDLDRRDNDPLYNPDKNIETILNNSETISPSEKLHGEMSDAMGKEHADFSMGLIEGRANAMGVTPDEFIAKNGITVEDMRDVHGVYIIWIKLIIRQVADHNLPPLPVIKVYIKKSPMSISLKTKSTQW